MSRTQHSGCARLTLATRRVLIGSDMRGSVRFLSVHFMECSGIAAKTRIWRARQLVNERARRDPALSELVAGVEEAR